MERKYTILVCGGRDYGDWDAVRDELDRHVYRVSNGLPYQWDLVKIVQGGASGADQLARRWANLRAVECVTYEADWDRHGRAAGPLRNQRMLDKEIPDLVLAFPGGRGTKDMISRSKKHMFTVGSLLMSDKHSTVIWKYNLKYGTNKIEMPRLSGIISCGIQNDEIVIWVLVDQPTPETETRVFDVVFTGEAFEYAHYYVGTVQDSRGLVYHIFDSWESG